MALVQGPALSIDARGAIAGVIVFSSWKGRAYVRQLVRPSNPKTPLQVAMRSMMRALSQAWDGLSEAQQASWDELAAAKSYSPFNAFISANMLRWSMYAGPYKATNSMAGSGTQAALGSATAVGAPGAVTVSINVGTLNQGWGLVIHRSLGATAAPVMTNAIRVLTYVSVGYQTLVDSGLAAGHYYYAFSKFTGDGSTVVADAAVADGSAT